MCIPLVTQKAHVRIMALCVDDVELFKNVPNDVELFQNEQGTHMDSQSHICMQSSAGTKQETCDVLDSTNVNNNRTPAASHEEHNERKEQ
jgi:hypothetical protein